MPFCPKCNCEYNEGFEICFDCEADLVSDPPPPIPEDHEGCDWVEVYTFPGTLYAQMAVELLLREGIPAYSFSQYGASALGVSTSGDVVGVSATVFVMEPDHDQSLELIEPMIEEIGLSNDDYFVDSED